MLNHKPSSNFAHSHFPALLNPQQSQQLSIQYQLDSSQWWPLEKIRSFQIKQAEIILRHAIKHVPFYKNLYEKKNFTLPEKITEESFLTIPIIERSDIQEASSSFKANSLPEGITHLNEASTSGSTGEPVTFSRDNHAHTFWLSFALREHLWHQRDFNLKLAAIRWFPKGSALPPHGVSSDAWGSIVAPLFKTGPACSLNVTATLGEQITWLNYHKPDYLLSYPSNLKAIADFAKKNQIPLPYIKEIRAIGETLSSDNRKIIEGAWNTKLTDIYSCEETGYMATQCPSSNLMHIQSENVLFEIVDEMGLPVKPNETGFVVVTSLQNFSSPFIRYKIGDMASFGEACNCGRNLPTLKFIHGRIRNRLYFPSGESRFPYLGELGQIEALTGVDVYQFQFIQHSVKLIELKLVASRPFNNDEEEIVRSKIQENFGHPFDIQFSFVSDILKKSNGKFEEFISLVGSA
jgi:phenylacetate-CoA ligase